MPEPVSEITTLQWPDYVVLGIVLLISAAIGVYYRFTGGRQKTAEEYFTADHSMGVVTLAVALMVSFVSAISILGISAEIYEFGTQFAMIYIGFALGVPIAMYFYLPVFYQLQTMSVFEYLQRRFGVTARLVSSIANFTHLMLFTGVVLYAPALALEATSGLSGNTSVMLIGTICIFYSTIGGIKAVIMTDVVQGVLMYISVLCVLAVAAINLEGGFANVWSISQRGQRIEFFDFSLDPTIRHTWWSLMTNGILVSISIYGVNQVQIQRLMSAKNLKQSRLAMALSVPLLIGLGCLTCYSGLVLYAMYHGCDPVASGKISTSDKIMPYFAAERMSRFPGLSGLFISGIFSASLSTISAMLNSLAAVALEDYTKPLYAKLGRPFPEDKAALIGKSLAAGNGVVCLCMAFLASRLGSLIQLAIAIGGVIGGPLLGIFTLGLFFEDANEPGAIVGMIVALLIGSAAMFGYPKPPIVSLPVSTDDCGNGTSWNNATNLNFNETVVQLSLNETSPSEDHTTYFYLFRISYMWYNAIGLSVTIAIGYLASLVYGKISGGTIREPDPNLFTPFVAARIRRRRADAGRTTSSQVFVLETKHSNSRDNL